MYRIPNNFCVTASAQAAIVLNHSTCPSKSSDHIRILSVGNTTISRRGGHFRRITVFAWPSSSFGASKCTCQYDCNAARRPAREKTGLGS
jgi:hypothetical protein